MNALTLDAFLWNRSSHNSDHSGIFIFPTEHTDLRYLDTLQRDKPSLIFFCDPPVQVESYGPLIELLGSDYRTVVIELPGFSQSKIKSGKALEFAETTSATAQLINSLNLQDFVLVAPCVTSFVAVSLVNHHGIGPSGLIFLQAPSLDEMKAWTNRMDPKKILRTPYLGQVLMRMQAKKLARFWMNYATGSKEIARKLAHQVEKGLKAGASYSLASMLQEWSKKGPKDGHLYLPSLSVWGLKDRSHRLTPCNCTGAHSAKMEHIEIPHTGHFSELEDTEQFVRLISPFLNKLLPLKV